MANLNIKRQFNHDMLRRIKSLKFDILSQRTSCNESFAQTSHISTYFFIPFNPLAYTQSISTTIEYVVTRDMKYTYVEKQHFSVFHVLLHV